jgi:hypothetical protein
MLGKLQGLFIMHNDCRLNVTGHGLGGALSTLFSFEAASDFFFKEKNVTNISFGSPYIGSWEFRKNFQKLEKLGRVRHLRVSNNDDVKPITLNTCSHRGIPILCEHVGVNRKLFRKSDPKISYPKPHSLASRVSRVLGTMTKILKCTIIIILRSPYSTHSCVEYRKRLKAEKEKLDKIQSLKYLYSDEKFTGRLFKY